jgi:hypothetical protein
MANQGNRQNTGKKGGRDREGNLGQSGKDIDNPTGTSGRQGNDTGQQSGEGDRGGRRNNADEDSPLGNRNTNR